MAKGKYQNPTSFLQALKDKMRESAERDGISLPRRRYQIAFERFLVRIFDQKDSYWVLKGGYALELRLKHARATIDLDLALHHETLRALTKKSEIQALVEILRTKTNQDLGDFFSFQIEGPVLELDAPIYGGVRLLVKSFVNRKVFSNFHLDVAAGDPLIEPVEIVESKNWLKFAGITSRGFPTLSKEQHFAEKIHAYTHRIEGRQNSRVKDLVDLVLLSRFEKMDQNRLKRSLLETFKRRKSHSLPKTFPRPPENWIGPFHAMAEQCELQMDITEAHQFISDFLAKNRLL